MILAALLLGTVTAAIVDLRCRRIPNVLCATLAFAGIAMPATMGLTAAAGALLAMAVALCIGTMVFEAGWLGGGDVKLVAACCAVVGAPNSVPLVLEILIAGGVLSLGALLLRRSAGVAAVTVPYGLAIAGGSLSFSLSTVIPNLRIPL